MSLRSPSWWEKTKRSWLPTSEKMLPLASISRSMRRLHKTLSGAMEKTTQRSVTRAWRVSGNGRTIPQVVISCACGGSLSSSRGFLRTSLKMLRWPWSRLLRMHTLLDSLSTTLGSLDKELVWLWWLLAKRKLLSPGGVSHPSKRLDLPLITSESSAISSTTSLQHTTSKLYHESNKL